MSFKNIEYELLKEKKNFEDDLHIINQSIKRIQKLANDLTQIKDPEIINYTSDSKMIKLD